MCETFRNFLKNNCGSPPQNNKKIPTENNRHASARRAASEMDPQAFAQMLQLNAMLSNGSITKETFDSMAAMVMAAARPPLPVQNTAPAPIVRPAAAATTPPLLTDGVHSVHTELATTPAGARAERPALRYVNLSQSVNQSAFSYRSV